MVVDRTKANPSQQQHQKYKGGNDDDEFDNYQRFNFLVDQHPDRKSVESFKGNTSHNARPQHRKVNSSSDAQPVFKNIMFRPETLGKSMQQSRKRPDEMSRSTINVKYEVPIWYRKDKNTNLYENMCMIDFVRNSNHRLVGHSPPRGSTKSLATSQFLNTTRFSPTRHKENLPNTSQKLDTPRSAKKWDKHIPRVILFVNKYFAGEMEDDVDDDRDTMPRIDYQPPPHSSPYTLDLHKSAYHSPKTQQWRLGQRSQLQTTQNGQDQGYFDFDLYRDSVKKKKQNKFAATDIDDFEEGEGVRQSARPTEIKKW